MGEVWRARDTTLGRDVAIKTLPEAFARDPDRLARFEREARLLASLNHPNIAVIHGLEESDGTRFLVLELIEGPTLADLLEAGPLPVEVALPIALQIAEALEAAHENGVIHRDLKPANIKVSEDHKVKVLDFGLAKGLDTHQGDVNLSESPTLTLGATGKGVILGTAAYMSPEQARGRQLDARTDIWAYGCILSEMLTGHPAFPGEDLSDILSSVLKSRPDWSGLPPLNPRLQELLERCLAKDSRNRYRHIGDVRHDLEKVVADPYPAPSVPDPAVRVPPSARLPRIGLAGLGLILAVAAGWYLKPEPPAERHGVTRFNDTLPDGIGFQNPLRQSVALSQDGKRLLYNGTGGFYVREMNDTDAVLIPGTGGWSSNPVFSPDGEEVAYFASTPTPGLRTISVSGGASSQVAPAFGLAFGLSWEDDGYIYWGAPDGIWRVPEVGGEADHLVTTEPPEQADGPELLPGGEWLLYTITTATGATRWDDADIVIRSISGEETHILVQGGSDARYLSTGHLLYSRGNNVYARTFDVNSLALGDERGPVLEGVQRADSPQTYTAATFYAVSDGTLIWIPAPNAASGKSLVWVDREERPTPLPIGPDDYRAARISPNGDKVALVIGDPGDIWILDLETENRRPLVSNPAGDRWPVWAPDGDRIYFASNRDETNGVYSISPDGGEASLIGRSDDFQPLPWSVSPDGQTLFIGELFTSPVKVSIATLPTSGGEFETLLTHAEDTYNEPVISPNEEWLAGIVGPLAEPRVQVWPYPEVEQRQTVVSGPSPSRSGAGFELGPAWSPDGSEIFFVTNLTLMAARVEYEPTLRIGTPGPLLRRRYQFGSVSENGLGGRAWDPHPDGERFLMIVPPNLRINTVLNWDEVLLERVPVP